MADHISFDEVTALLDRFETIRFYFWDLFKAQCGISCKTAGVTPAEYNPVIVTIVNDPILAAHIDDVEDRRYNVGCERKNEAEEALAPNYERLNLHDYMPSRPRDWAYEQVVAMIQNEWPQYIRAGVLRRISRWLKSL